MYLASTSDYKLCPAVACFAKPLVKEVSLTQGTL